MKVVPSEYGWTALHDSGRAVAHAKDLKLLEAYLADLGGPAKPRPGAPLTEITYRTRARSTGAATAAGRTATGFGVHCLPHGELADQPNRTAAETAVSRPQEWCTGCAEIAEGRAPRLPKETDLL